MSVDFDRFDWMLDLLVTGIYVGLAGSGLGCALLTGWWQKTKRRHPAWIAVTSVIAFFVPYFLLWLAVRIIFGPASADD